VDSLSDRQRYVASEAVTCVTVASEVADEADRGISRLFCFSGFLLDHHSGRGGGSFVWILIGSLLLEESDGQVCAWVERLEQHYSEIVSDRLKMYHNVCKS
jgi:hypothetical protein